jgi:hypothetical protein
MNKKTLKDFVRKEKEKKVLEKIGPKIEVTYNWNNLKEELNELILNDKEFCTLKIEQVLTLINDYHDLNKVFTNLQLGAILCLKRHNTIAKEIVDKISILFDNNEKKVVAWFYLINPELEGCSPMDYCIIGREKEVLNHVNKKIEELMEVVEE